MIPFSIEFLEKQEDKDFIENLYIRYGEWLKYRASKIIDNDAGACADVAHDCMINMIKHIDKLKSLSEEKQRAYLAVSIDNAALNYVTKQSRVLLMCKPEAADLDFIADSHDLEIEVEKMMDIEAVRNNVDLLPARDRDLIVLKYELEMSNEQIGEIFNIKKDSVKMTLRRSVQKLAKHVNKKGDM